MNEPESFETIVKACTKTSDFLPAWQKFANTMFFVAVLPDNPEAANGGFDFIVHISEKTKGPAVVIAETLEHLKNPATNKAIRINGTRLIAMLPVEAGVLVALSDGAFGIPATLVGWLRATIETG
jgi:hypothetical protein